MKPGGIQGAGHDDDPLTDIAQGSSGFDHGIGAVK